VLFIPGEPFSGAIYHEVALLLAEQGVPAAALSLGWQGYGRWASIDLGSLDDITVEQCLHRYVAPVHLELRQPDSALVLAGDGLGGILAQCFAQRHPDLAGIALLGSCTPHRASQVWRSGLSWQGTHRAPEADAYLSVEEVRATYLHNAASADQAFLLWQKMRQVRPARLSQDYGRLTRQSFITPAVPVMLIAGQQDHLIPPGVLEATAADYGVQPHVLDGAPYLVAWTHASTVAELLFQAITNTLSVKQ
jgi:pimeloyl-ACP methyl ester carboxylesterase